MNTFHIEGKTNVQQNLVFCIYNTFLTYYLSYENQSDRSNRNLCNLVNDVTLGYVIHTIVPEKIRFTKHQREHTRTYRVLY